MGISVVYNFRVDLDLDIGNTAIRRILYACDSCLV